MPEKLIYILLIYNLFLPRFSIVGIKKIQDDNLKVTALN